MLLPAHPVPTPLGVENQYVVNDELPFRRVTG
jgi:hypothetical protein